MTVTPTNSNLPVSAADADLLAELDQPKRGRWIVALLLLAAVAAGGYYYSRRSQTSTGPRFLFGRVTRGTVIEKIEATGTVQPVVQVQVGSQVSGRVRSISADFNQRVRAGEVLAELDTEPFAARVAETQASLLSARASYARARAEVQLQERNLTRAQELRRRGLNSEAELDSVQGAHAAARAQVAVAEAELARAQAVIETARTNLRYARILAPIDGVVISRSIEPGATVAASFQSPTLFVLANDLTQMRVIADIDEADVGRLREGMQADARVDAFTGEIFRGVVRELRFGPNTSQGVVTYPAVISVPNPELKLRPGMTATLSVVTARRENVLRVPNAALRFRPSSRPAGATGEGRPGRSNGENGAARANGNGDSAGTGEEEHVPAGPRMGRLFVDRNGQATRIRVRVGVSDGTFTEVEGDELREGLEVIIDETDDSSRGAGAAGGSRPAGSSGSGGMRRMF